MSKTMKIESRSKEVLDVVTPKLDLSESHSLTPQPDAEGKTTVASVEIPEGTVVLQEGDKPIVSDEDPVAAAGALFALYGTRLYGIVDTLSAKQLRRLVKALCTYPLEDVFINKKVQVENDAYQLASRMIESKFLITLQTGWEEEERRKKAAEEYKASEAAKQALETNNQGENNV